MRNLLLLFFFFILFCQQGAFAASNITFIYVNGSNTNTPQDKEWFENGVNRLHPRLKIEIEKKVKSEYINSSIKEYSINPEPRFMFWGYDSAKSLEFMKARLVLTKPFSPIGAYLARNFISAMLHDAIWVQKPVHLFSVIESLNKIVQEESKKGNKVVLLGYSAGTSVTYEYLLNELRAINFLELLQAVQPDSEMMDYVKKNPRKNTCVSAISSGEIGFFDRAGKFELDKNRELLKESYLKLDELSDAYCAPEGVVLGIVNYASPLSVFYSDLGNTRSEFSLYNKYMVKNVFDDGLFFVTVNFIEDPLGFPVSMDLRSKEVAKKIGVTIKDGANGFVYDDSSVRSWRPFVIAHNSYYKADKIFSRAVAKAISDGRRIQYDDAYYQKIKKKF